MAASVILLTGKTPCVDLEQQNEIKYKSGYFHLVKLRPWRTTFVAALLKFEALKTFLLPSSACVITM